RHPTGLLSQRYWARLDTSFKELFEVRKFLAGASSGFYQLELARGFEEYHAVEVGGAVLLYPELALCLVEVEVEDDLESARPEPFGEANGLAPQAGLLGDDDEMYLVVLAVASVHAKQRFDVHGKARSRCVVAVLAHELVVSSAPYER